MGTNTISLGLGNNGTSVSGLHRIKTRQVSTSFELVNLGAGGGEVKSSAVLSGRGRDGRGAHGEETENVGELHFE